MWSPGLSKNIGYVWVPIELAEPGTAIDVESEHGPVTGRTAAIPFVDPRKERPAASLRPRRSAEPGMRDARYDVLFEPVPLGPVTARNRFFQVPHCNGMGHAHPSAHAEMRGVKAEGGWAVVCTEEVELHHSTDVAGYIEGRLWDDADIPDARAAGRARCTSTARWPASSSSTAA